ncbi:MAG: ATP-binding protein [Candidatus Limiplasma sp.]|nr:ATP-binding protein [Candidatus Limiplasma sp.]
MKHRIALKLLAYFAVALAVFAGLSGTLFQTMFSRRMVETKRAELLTRATSLAGMLSEVLTDSGAASETTAVTGSGAAAETPATVPDSTTRSGAQGSGGKGKGNASGASAAGGAGNGAQGAGGTQGAGGAQNGAEMGYGAYVRVLSRVEPNVWVLDEQLEFLSGGHMKGQTLTYADLPADAEAVVQAVFAGQTPISEGFSDLLGTPTLSVGAPIRQGDRIAGALLLHDAVSGVQAVAAQGVTVLLASGAAALAVAIVLAALLSWRFAGPLEKMRRTAQRMTEGEYAARTGVHRRDEIGRLAVAMDGLGGRLEEARAAADRQEQQRRDFLANVSHELRTPVTVLRGSLEALCDGVVTEPAQAEAYHRQMLRETVTLQRLVNDLMDLARLQNPDFPTEHAPVNLTEVLGDALYSAGQMARAKSIRLERRLPEAPVPLTGDYGRLRQMFLIVLDNAVKYSPEASTVTVTLTPAYAEVRDEGPGIPPEEIPLLFERFHRARATAESQGSGLGLSIAKEIAARHQMRIVMESLPGHGATFRFIWDAPAG